MNLSDLLLSSSPSSPSSPSSSSGLHLVQTDESTLCDLGWKIAATDSALAVRTIRGKKCRTRGALFDEMGAALQFPYYFGENWDAFDEVVTDLSWLPEESFLLLFTRADLVLEGLDPDFKVLAELLAEAHESWAKEKIPFHVVFQCVTGEALAALSQRLERAGKSFDRVEPV